VRTLVAVARVRVRALASVALVRVRVRALASVALVRVRAVAVAARIERVTRWVLQHARRRVRERSSGLAARVCRALEQFLDVVAEVARLLDG
jgi:hypothetical protein